MHKQSNSEAAFLCEKSSFQESEGAKNFKRPASVASVGGIPSAFLTSLCCIGPVLFAGLGVSAGATGYLANTAGFLKAFVPYRPFPLLSLWSRLEPDFISCIANPKPLAPQAQIVRIHEHARNRLSCSVWLRY